MSPMVQGLLRHLFTALGGLLVAHGYIDQSTVEPLAGLFITAVGAAWSVIDKWERS